MTMPTSFQAWRDAMTAAASSYDTQRAVDLLDLDVTFLASCYDDVLSHVLTEVAPAWLTSMQLAKSGGSGASLLDAIDALMSVKTSQRLSTHHGRPIQTLFLALTAWQPAWSDVTCRLGGRELDVFIGTDGISLLFTELLRAKASEASMDIVISRIGAIPAKMHNLYQHDTPARFTPSTYYTTLVHGFLSAMRSPHQFDLESDPTSTLLARLFLLKLSRQAHMNTFVQGWLGNPSPALGVHLAKAVPSICYSSLVPAVISHVNATNRAASITTTLSWMQDLVGHPVCQHELTKLVLHTPLHVETHRVLVRLLFTAPPSSQPSPTTPFEAIFHRVVLAWASATMTAAETKRLVSTGRFLAAGLDLLAESTSTPKAVLDQHGWVAYLCKGVQEHMGHALIDARHSAMRVATALSRILSPESPLVFEDLPPDEVAPIEGYQSIPTPTLTFTTAQEDLELELQGSSAVDAHKVSPTDEDDELDAVVRSDSEDDGESDDDAASVVSLEPYDDLSDADDEDAQQLVDSSDANSHIDQVLQRRPPLVYLWQVKEGLLADENRDATEVALASLPRIIGRRPHDLPHMAVEIATVLLRLDDMFETPHFDSLRRQSLVGLCVHVPDVVTPMLCDYIYDNQRLFQTKLAILQAVGDAASAIATTKAVHSPAHFFFPLLNPLHAKLMHVKASRIDLVDRDNEWGGSQGRHVLDDVLMAHVLQALSRVLEATGPNSPAVLTMGKRFLELLWSQRSHALPSVRRQVFFGLSRVMLVLPPFAWREEVERLHLGPHLVPFLQHHTTMDPDGGCRAAAKLLLSTVATSDQR